MNLLGYNVSPLAGCLSGLFKPESHAKDYKDWFDKLHTDPEKYKNVTGTGELLAGYCFVSNPFILKSRIFTLMNIGCGDPLNHLLTIYTQEPADYCLVIGKIVYAHPVLLNKMLLQIKEFVVDKNMNPIVADWVINANKEVNL